MDEDGLGVELQVELEEGEKFEAELEADGLTIHVGAEIEHSDGWPSPRRLSARDSNCG